MDKIEGFLEIGVNDKGEVVVNYPGGKIGHLVFSVGQARNLARLLLLKAMDALACTGITIRCIKCGVEFNDSLIANAVSCPACGTKSLPCSTQQDVLLPMNRSESVLVSQLGVRLFRQGIGRSKIQ